MTNERQEDRTTDTYDQIDGAFTALEDARRRDVLRYLIRTSAETTSIGSLASHLRATRDDRPPAPKELELRLHHVHLPRLDRAGLVEYDPRAHEVRYRENALVESVLATVPDER